MHTEIQNGPERIIENRLSAIRRRMQLNLLLSRLVRFGFWGLVVAGFLLIINRFTPLPIPISLAVLIPIVTAFAAAICLSLSRSADLFAVARSVDRHLNLKERLSTALAAIRRGSTDDDFVRLQINDAGHVAQTIVPAASFPYTLPLMLRWIPIALLLIASAFVIPQMYETPPPPTAAERDAIDQAAEALESAELSGFTELARLTRDTIKGLRKKDIDANQSQAKLSKLRDVVRTKKIQVQGGMDNLTKSVSEADEQSKYIKGRTASEIASDLEKLANQLEGLTPEQRRELEISLKKIAQRLSENPAFEGLTNQLAELQTKAVSAEMLQRIARLLNRSANEADQLERILEQIKTNRRNIALAGIDMDLKKRGVATSGSGSGDDSDTSESQKTISDKKPPPISPPSDESQTDLELAGPPSDSQEFAQVYIEEDPTGEGEPTYMSYREVYLHTQQAYAQAIERDEIPLKYREQVKAYLEAVANLDAKSRNQ
jgi:hypothetical protein